MYPFYFLSLGRKNNNYPCEKWINEANTIHIGEKHSINERMRSDSAALEKKEDETGKGTWHLNNGHTCHKLCIANSLRDIFFDPYLKILTFFLIGSIIHVLL